MPFCLCFKCLEFLYEKNNKIKKTVLLPSISLLLLCNIQWIKIVVAERFIRTLKNKICKHIAAVSKNVCIDKLEDIVNQYKNIYYTENN